MPWVCQQCGLELLDDEPSCSSCGNEKTSWSMVAAQTREFTVSRSQVQILRGGRPVIQLVVLPAFLFSA